jgi:hypothetical protein
MKPIFGVFKVIHALIALLFGCFALMLIASAGRAGWLALGSAWDGASAQAIIEAVGLLAAAAVSLQMAETITEEEIIREADVSAPTRARRFLSRFFVVVVVALAIEGLVATFKAIHEDMTHLAYAAAIVLATGLLLAAWGLFVRLNRAAEELEPEAMEEAKREDHKVQ